MENRTIKKVTCNFCGKTRDVTYVEDDGCDFYGHSRGRAENYVIDKGCDCKLGRIEKQKQTIKKMCLNCTYCDGTYCKNREIIKKVSGMFNMPQKLEVIDMTKKCEEWKLNMDIFKALIN